MKQCISIRVRSSNLVNVDAPLEDLNVERRSDFLEGGAEDVRSIGALTVLLVSCGSLVGSNVDVEQNYGDNKAAVEQMAESIARSAIERL